MAVYGVARLNPTRNAMPRRLPAPKCVPLNGFPKLNAYVWSATLFIQNDSAGVGTRSPCDRPGRDEVDDGARLDAAGLEVHGLRSRSTSEVIESSVVVTLHSDRRACW